MKFKQTLLAGAAALAVTFALCPAAQARNDDTTPLTGFYVGGFGGSGWTRADTAGGPTFKVDGADWGAFAGYDLGTFLNKNSDMGIEGAIEAYYAWSNADDTRVVGVTPTRMEKNHEWGASFRPGFSFISSAMPLGLKPYAILGYRRAEFDSSATGSEEHNGFELGAGTELVAYHNFGVRLDYSHVFYDSRHGVDPDENDLRLGAAYHF